MIGLEVMRIGEAPEERIKAWRERWGACGGVLLRLSRCDGLIGWFLGRRVYTIIIWNNDYYAPRMFWTNDLGDPDEYIKDNVLCKKIAIMIKRRDERDECDAEKARWRARWKPEPLMLAQASVVTPAAYAALDTEGWDG